MSGSREITPARDRDRYIDSLRALALIRVVTYHLLGWAWLPLAFPSMGIMFALAGSLVAASLDRRDQWSVIGKRVRRLLPPLWAMGAILVPVMLLRGWTWDSENYIGSPLTWDSLIWWVIPLYTPPGSEWGYNFVLPLWYVRTYLWLLVLSGALLWLFRRWPLPTLLTPLVMLGLTAVGMVVPNGSRSDEIIMSLCVYAACWILGFAHHDNKIRSIPRMVVVAVSAACLSAGSWWAYTHQLPLTGWNIGEIPVANALYCLGAVLLVLRFKPSFDWMAGVPFLDRLVSLFNARAMTIYLWGNVAIYLAIGVENRYVTGHWYGWADTGWSRTIQYALTWVFLLLVVLALGWVEDVAGRRKPRLFPWRRASQGSLPQRSRHTATPVPRSPADTEVRQPVR